jgi:hypothetical protein
LKTAPVEDILAAYKIAPESFKQLVSHPIFRQEIRDMKTKLKEEGFSFRVKLQAQAEAYLSEAWNLVHDPETPANVKADIIKWSVKTAGLETSANNSQSIGQDLGKLAEEIKNMPAGELEVRALQILVKKSEHSGRVVSES